ncbi:uncharacterized protein FIBRA_04974 [Fibroporia radiculosa]|uniref:Major facilitator superfamily (MFS) profile domain-containing protein n=1 Tax=Fibroporia radiculosa TaxID=599839 RepID=J4HWU3_9APHY|nr:uncharacterized protein FIBRA_04974 [Fibroporia radiculosa]CCM02862.1 predicted protein [Fibroporia radiculosa]
MSDPQPATLHDIETGTGPSSDTKNTNSVYSALVVHEEKEYPGSGTLEDPYVVDWKKADPENPFNWSKRRKWVITSHLAYATWVASFCSSSYSAGLTYTAMDLHLTTEVAILGVSLYILGFTVGPLFWAPMSESELDDQAFQLIRKFANGESICKRNIFIGTFTAFTLLHLGGSLCKNTATLLATRMLAGMFGVSPFTNSSAAMSDMWIPRERGFPGSLYACAIFLGPVIGPVIGGWVAMSYLGWRFNFWIMFILSGVTTIGFVVIEPETYAPVLLRRRAERLRRGSGNNAVYISKYDVGHSRKRIDIFRKNMVRPFVFLATEPIVLLLAIYGSIAYAILYAFFAAFPIVFQEQRGWSSGLGGLAFIGVGVGTTLGLCLTPIQNRMYQAAAARSPTGRAAPEQRLYAPMFGAICLPIGMFWFAWTSSPHIFWLSPILAGVPFGIGVALVLFGATQYLVDGYQIYAASALAATVVLRSVVAAVFPLIIPTMYKNLGDGWACSVFAFLVTACMPIPFLFYKYGPWLRKHSKWAVQDATAPSMSVVPPPGTSAKEKSSN